MEIVKIHEHKLKPFYILVDTKTPIHSIINKHEYNRDIMDYLKQLKELYDDTYSIIDMVEETPFFTFYAKTLGFIPKNVCSKNRKLYLQSCLMNEIKTIECEETPTRYNEFLKKQNKVACLIVDNIKKLRFCRRPLKKKCFLNIIVIGETNDVELDFNLEKLLLENGYKKIILNSNVILFRHMTAKVKKPIVVYFD
tara:strand:- start:540 stop:1127 length:588 start_codon:yes stop_codon:yes gene_type:complete